MPFLTSVTILLSQGSVMLPMMFSHDFGDQIGQYATLIDPNNNRFPSKPFFSQSIVSSFSPSPPSLFSPSNLLQLDLSSLRLLSLVAFSVFAVASF